MDLKQNEQRAKNAIILIWIVLALEMVNLISSCLQYDLLQTIANGGSISDEAAASNDNREQLLGILHVIAIIVSGITFILWFRRAYYNLHQKSSRLSFSEGWAAGSWFVPILCWFRPYQIMKELCVETKNLLSKNGFSEQPNDAEGYLGWWWALWLTTGFIGYFNLQYSRHAKIVDDYIVITVGQMISNILTIPLAIITVKVIKDYSKVEPLLFQITEDNGTEEKSGSNNNADTLQ
jgi:hypothetical protein